MEKSVDYTEKTMDRKSVLKEYFKRYLSEVRGLSNASVAHYFDALNHISRRLKAKGFVHDDIYEIADIDRLDMVREALYADEDFISVNERGKRMYSAGLNNYYRFANGEDFYSIRPDTIDIDIPVDPEAAVTIEQSVWRRSGILRTQAIEMAGYRCEMDSSHKSFISGRTHKPFMEGHHALPMNAQTNFHVSLDVYANIICLCPLCHRKIHYGLRDDRVNMISQLYDKRINRLVNSGIEISKENFVEIAISF
ncbi:MAG: hypothetical protein IJK00_00180 [Clostridia bacterium]|nr:hypothetical protein [Clostridia bacterium]